MKIRSTLSLALVACLPTGAVWAQATPAAPSPAAPAAPATPTTPGAAKPAASPTETSPSLLDALKLPDLRKMNLPLPRSVQAANALLGLSTQRLALVVGTGNVGPQIQLPSVSRDTQAIAAALRAAGFMVMVREDLNAEDLRAALDEFRGRLQPGGTGFLYFAGLGAQVGGENVVLTRGLQVTGTGADTRIRGTAVPLQEIVEAVQGTPDSARYLVVDAAFSHPTLATISSKGLGAQKVPPGVMALFSQNTGVAAPAPEPFPLPLPTPTDPRLTAGSTFGRELVRSLVTPKLNGAEILRVTRGAMLDVTAGQQAPLIVGDSASTEEFAEPDLLDTLFPRTPEDLAREGLKQAMRAGSNAGEVPVSQVGNTAPVSTTTTTAPPASTPPAPPPPAPTATATETAPETSANGPQRNALESASRRLADGPSPTSLLSTAAGATAAVGSVAAGAAGTAAVAGTMAATAQAGAMATAMGVATSVASSAVGVLSSVASLVSGGSSSGGSSAAAAVAAKEASKLVRPASAVGALSQAGGGDARSQVASAAANSAPVATAATAAAAPAAAPAATPAAAPSATTAQATAPVSTPTAAAAQPTPAAATTAAPTPAAQAGTAPATPTGTANPNPPGSTVDGGTTATAQGTDPNAAQRQMRAQSAQNGGEAAPATAAGPAAPAAPAAATPVAELPVEAVNGTAAVAASGGLPPAVPRNAVPQSFTADQLPGAGQAPAGPARTAKQQGGGERPAYVPKVNPFGYAEGDTFMYRTMDTWKDQHLGNVVQTVEEVLPNGDMLANGHQTVLDAQGRFKRLQQLDGTVSQFEPAQELWWSNPARGQSRDIRFKESFQRADRSRGETEWKGSASVGRLRKISTQAGEFEAFPIESSGWYYEQVGRGPLNSGQWSRTVWYSPQLGHPVAIDIEDANALGKLLRRERVELLQVQTAKSQAAQAAQATQAAQAAAKP